MAEPVYFRGRSPRVDRREPDYSGARCFHGAPAATMGGLAIWPCPDCYPEDCRDCRPWNDKRDKRGRCAAHREKAKQ